MYHFLYDLYLPLNGRVMEPFAGTLSSAVALLEWSAHKGNHFWRGFEPDQSLLTAATSRLIEKAAVLWPNQSKILV